MRKPGAKVPSASEGFRYSGVRAGRVPRHRDLRETWFKGNSLTHRAFAQTTLALPSQVGGPFRASLDAYLFSTRLQGVRQRIFRGHNTHTSLILKGILFSPTTGYRWFSLARNRTNTITFSGIIKMGIGMELHQRSNASNAPHRAPTLRLSNAGRTVVFNPQNNSLHSEVEGRVSSLRRGKHIA